MKLILATLIGSAAAFAPMAPNAARSMTALNAKVGIFYSTQTGNTETIAGYISEAAGVEMADIGDATDGDVTGLDTLIVGAPTWHTDEESERSGTEWDKWLYNTLPNLDIKGKNVAVFGVGDQQSYNDVRLCHMNDCCASVCADTHALSSFLSSSVQL
jgi:flavodoxin